MTEVSPLTTFERAHGALLGLALGDAIGLPALFHRAVRFPAERGILWKYSAELDSQQVNKFSLPFTPYHPERLGLSGTDDTEFAAVSARILVAVGANPTPQGLFDGWVDEVVVAGGEIWSGVSERASIENARKGLVPPATGRDNPHHFDDGAVSRSVPVGIRFAGRPERAAEVAGWAAHITNDADGVWAAQAMAATISAAVAGADVNTAVTAGVDQVPEDSWLGRTITRAKDALDREGSGFAAAPAWNDEIVGNVYNFGNVAPETLAIAYAVLLACDGDLVSGVQLAALVPKLADSMPAMVGAVCGALQGASVIPATWQDRLENLRGHAVPSTAGVLLADLAKSLVALAEADR
jgi:ADP-ribosylglycohydrolase